MSNLERTAERITERVMKTIGTTYSTKMYAPTFKSSDFG